MLGHRGLGEIMKTKRFILFSGFDYYPHGGWEDFHNSFDAIDEARNFITPEPRRRANNSLYLIYLINSSPYDWYQLIDLDTGKKINLFPNPVESYI